MGIPWITESKLRVRFQKIRHQATEHKISLTQGVRRFHTVLSLTWGKMNRMPNWLRFVLGGDKFINICKTKTSYNVPSNLYTLWISLFIGPVRFKVLFRDFYPLYIMFPQKVRCHIPCRSKIYICSRILYIFLLYFKQKSGNFIG